MPTNSESAACRSESVWTYLPCGCARKWVQGLAGSVMDGALALITVYCPQHAAEADRTSSAAFTSDELFIAAVHAALIRHSSGSLTAEETVAEISDALVEHDVEDDRG